MACFIPFVHGWRSAPTGRTELVINPADDIAAAYATHGGAVFGLAFRLLHDRGTAEDVVQDVFTRLWARPDRFDPSRGSLRSYLLADCHGRAVDRIRADRARSRREVTHAGRSAAPPSDVGDEICAAWEAARLHEQLRQLPEREAVPIALAYFAGHTYREVAELLGIPEGTAKSRLRLGMAKLAGMVDVAEMSPWS